VLGGEVLVEQVAPGGRVVARVPLAERCQPVAELREGPPGRLGHQRLLGGEPFVEPAVGEAGRGHQVGDADALHAPFAEQPRRLADHPLAVLLRLCLGHPCHVAPPPPAYMTRII
jgi:hypothetical protein